MEGRYRSHKFCLNTVVNWVAFYCLVLLAVLYTEVMFWWQLGIFVIFRNVIVFYAKSCIHFNCLLILNTVMFLTLCLIVVCASTNSKVHDPMFSAFRLCNFSVMKMYDKY